MAAEQIFRIYFDSKDQAKSNELVLYIVEAIQSSRQALNYYEGKIDDSGVIDANYVNKYGLGLQNFHLGYLYENYAAHLVTESA